MLLRGKAQLGIGLRQSLVHIVPLSLEGHLAAGDDPARAGAAGTLITDNYLAGIRGQHDARHGAELDRTRTGIVEDDLLGYVAVYTLVVRRLIAIVRVRQYIVHIEFTDCRRVGKVEYESLSILLIDVDLFILVKEFIQSIAVKVERTIRQIPGINGVGIHFFGGGKHQRQELPTGVVHQSRRLACTMINDFFDICMKGCRLLKDIDTLIRVLKLADIA